MAKKEKSKVFDHGVIMNGVFYPAGQPVPVEAEATEHGGENGPDDKGDEK